MRKLKRLIICIMLIGIVGIFTACDGQIDIFRYSDENYYYEDIRIILSTQCESDIHSSATIREGTEKWTLSSYFTHAAAYANERAGLSEEGIGYKFLETFTDSSTSSVAYIIVGRFNLPSENYQFQHNTESENLFLRTIKYEVNNLLIGVEEQFVKGEEGNHAIEAINGVGTLPPIFEAFTYFNNKSSAFLNTTQYIASNRKSFSDDTSAIYATVYASGDAELLSFLPFKEVLGLVEDPILSYKTLLPVSVGWYLVALSLGAIVVGILFLRVHLTNKRNKPEYEIVEENESPSEDGLIENQTIEVNGPPAFRHYGMYNSLNQNTNPFAKANEPFSEYSNNSQTVEEDIFLGANPPLDQGPSDNNPNDQTKE